MFIPGKDFIVCRSLTTMRAVKDSLFSLLNLPDDGRKDSCTVHNSTCLPARSKVTVGTVSFKPKNCCN